MKLRKQVRKSLFILFGLCLLTIVLGRQYRVIEIKEAKANELLVKYQTEANKSAELSNTVKTKDEHIQKLAGMLTNKPSTISFLENNILPYSRKYGIPDALVAGQWVIESGRSKFRPDNNYFGIMSWPNGKRTLRKCADMDECMKVHASTIKRILSVKGYDLAKVKDPVKILEILQQGKSPRYEGDNPDQYHYVGLVANTNEFKFYQMLAGI